MAAGRSGGRRVHRTRIPGLYRVDASQRFPEGGWKIRYRDNDGGTRERTFRTKQEALDFQASIRTDKNRGDFISPRLALTPFRELAERWYEKKRGMGRTEATLAGYRGILDTHLLPEFGNRSIGSITAEEIEAMLQRTGRAAGTQRNILRVLGPIMDLAVRNKMIRANPCPLVEIESGQRTEARILTAEQVDDLAREIGDRWSTLVFFAAYTGMRAGEIVALKRRHLDLMNPARGRVTVEASTTDVNGKLVAGRTKNKKSRTVVLPRFLTERLIEHTAGMEPGGFVFTGTGGRQLRHGNFYGRHFLPAAARIGLHHRFRSSGSALWCRLCRDEREADVHDGAPFRFHDLRHTAASLLIARGVHPKIVSEHLGHSSITITMDRYGHLYRGDAEEVVASALDRTFDMRDADHPTAHLLGSR